MRNNGSKTILSILLFTTVLFAEFDNSKCDQIIDKKFFTICYSYEYKGALAVWYSLDGDFVNKLNIKKRPSFYTEKNLKKKYRSTSKDYVRSGYDRGHLANDASFDYNKKIIKKTYSMANIIPQAPIVNRKTWIKAEKLERKVAVGLGNVNVLNGVIYNSNPKRIGKNKIAVPSGFWKMIYNNEKNYKKCFYYKNDLSAVSKGDKLKNHLIDCNKLM